MVRYIVALAVVSTLMSAAAESAAGAEGGSSLKVFVNQVRNDRGNIRVALWSNPEHFTDGDRVLLETIEPASSGRKLVEIQNLKPGLYALAVYHDENANGEFDQTWIGMPAEGLAFSNGAWISPFGPPSFEEAAIEVNGSTVTEVDLRY